MAGVLPVPSDCCTTPSGETICLATPIGDLAEVLGWYFREDVATARDIANSSINKVLVVAGNRLASWDAASTAVDDGTESTPAIKPNDTLAADPGRWI